MLRCIDKCLGRPSSEVGIGIIFFSNLGWSSLVPAQYLSEFCTKSSSEYRFGITEKGSTSLKGFEEQHDYSQELHEGIGATDQVKIITWG
jgi:hypothetical protein